MGAFQWEHYEITCIFSNVLLKCSSNLEVHSSVTKRARDICIPFVKKLICCCIQENQKGRRGRAGKEIKSWSDAGELPGLSFVFWVHNCPIIFDFSNSSIIYPCLLAYIEISCSCDITRYGREWGVRAEGEGRWSNRASIVIGQWGSESGDEVR